MEGHFSTGQSPQWAVVPLEEEEEVTEHVVTFMCICALIDPRTMFCVTLIIIT